MTSLRWDDQLVTEHDAMAEAVFNYFSDILGSVGEHAFSINQSLLRDDSFDLSELEAPFMEEEI